MHDLVGAFGAYLREQRMRQPGTIKRYLGVMEEFTEFLGDVRGTAAVDLDAVDKDEVVRFLCLPSPKTTSPSRSVWNARLAALRAFHDYLFKQGVITVNPALRVDRLKTHAREPVPLSLDEALRLVDAMGTAAKAYRARNVALVQVLFHCALRVAELVSLRLDQVDLENYVFLDVRTKGDKWLSVPFNDVVAESLGRYLPDRARLVKSEAESALFLSDRGSRLSVRSVQELVKRYAVKAGIGRTVTPHLLRHSSATQLVEMGTSMRVVQEICGHASVTTTERYVHVNGGERRRAIDDLGAKWTRRAATHTPKRDHASRGSHSA